jgi:hypothetical protein
MSYKNIFPFLIVLVLTSCETIVQVDIPDHKPSIVINSVIDPTEKFQVHLSKSLGSLDSAPLSNIDNAEVEVYENDVLIEKLKFEESGIYSSSTINAKLGRNYKIVAKAAPFDDANAVARIPEPVSIESIVFKDSAYVDLNMGVKSSISFTIKDPSAIKNYYQVELFQTDSTFSDKNPIFFTPKDPVIEADGFSYFTDSHFNGKNYKFEMEFYSYGNYSFDPITGEYIPDNGKHYFIMEFSTISREYYLYKTSYDKQFINSFNPFAEPVQVFSNVNNGYGIFAGKVKISYQFEN